MAQDIRRQLTACGCDKAYYFDDQLNGMNLHDYLDRPADEWLRYLHSGEFVEDGCPPSYSMSLTCWPTRVSTPAISTTQTASSTTSPTCRHCADNSPYAK